MKKSVSKKAKKVRFQLTTEPGSQVFVAGTFNAWDATKHPLSATPDSVLHQATLEIPPGRHEYKFVVNGEWRMDPECTDWAPNGHGSLNNVLMI